MRRAARAFIDLAALKHNFRQVQRHAPGARIMAVVKADAYGHGLAAVSRALVGADAFAVASLEDALVIREVCKDRRPVILLQGVFTIAELKNAARNGFEPVVHTPEQVEMLERVNLPKSPKVWLKIDTGMNRLGFQPQRAAAIWERLRCIAAVREIGMMTHLACADARDNAATREQLRLFFKATDKMNGSRSIANSAGVLAWPQSHADWVRPGIMLYGASPMLGCDGMNTGLRPVMTLTSRLIAVKSIRKGEAVGYGASYRAPEDATLGIAAIGYGDGYPRHAGNGTPVLVNGRRAQLAGRVSMDMIAIDLGTEPHANVGDPVVAWGEGLAVEEVASAAGTIAYELLCGVTARVDFNIIRTV